MPTALPDIPPAAERRMFVRRDVRDRIEALRTQASATPATGRARPHLTLALRDLSVGGLSALSDLPLHLGERLAVFFPPQAARHGWDAYGRVLRCETSAMGYRVALAFERVPAVAA